MFDDDTTMKAQLKHSFKCMIKFGKMEKTNWPRTKGGATKNDTGRLPLYIKPPLFKANPNHRKKVVGNFVV